MAGRTVKRLYDLEIDEISLVDRSANQHADVAIAKRDEGAPMGTLMDVEGYTVSPEELQPGEAVLDLETGEVHVACEEGAEPSDYFGDNDPASQFEGFEFDDSALDSLEGSEVGKAGVKVGVKVAGRGEKALYRSKDALGSARRQASHARTGFSEGRAGLPAADSEGTGGFRAGAHVGRNRFRYGAAAAGAGGYALAKRDVSLGESVYEELSKALGSDQRDQVISKAMEQARQETLAAQQSAEEAWNIAKSLQDEQEFAEFYEVAKGYNLPGDPYEIAVILKSAADTMPVEHVEALDRMFSSAGEQIYTELGTGLGAQDSSVHSQIEAMANQAVTKSDTTEAQAIVALYEANADAYDQYLAETR